MLSNGFLQQIGGGFTNLVKLLRFYRLNADIRRAVSPLPEAYLIPPYLGIFARGVRCNSPLGKLTRNYVGVWECGPLAAHLPQVTQCPL
jgi:hypothetical protein